MNDASSRFMCSAGIAIGPILFIIAVFAILAAAIAASSSSFTSGTSTESGKAMATAILQQADLIRGAAQIVTAENGCADTQISFSNPILTAANGGTDAFANPNAPTNHSCDIFNAAGGRLNYQTPPVAGYGDTYAPLAQYTWNLTGNVRVFGIGSGLPALILALNHINNTTCMAINTVLGIANNGSLPPTDPFNAISFVGSYGANPGPLRTDGWPHEIGDDYLGFVGQPQGCGVSYGGGELPPEI